jgi:cystathionine gamma-lyase
LGRGSNLLYIFGVDRGGIPSPFDCFLAQRGIKTLPLRALQHGINALYIASRLQSNSLVSEVRYPGLADSEFYERAKWSLSSQAKRDLRRLGWNLDENNNSSNGHTELDKERTERGIPFSGMVTIRLRANEAQTEKFLQSLRLFALAESLGGVESLAEAPWKMTHGSIPVEDRLKAGITENLVRLSVGIEDREDLLADLERGLKIAIQD